MSRVKFNHVFTVLLLLSVLSAFVFPRKTSNVRAHVQGIFYPVAWPARLVASTVRGQFDRPDDKRAAEDVVAENHRLRAVVASLSGQIEDLLKQETDRARFGDLAKQCVPVAVMGNDPASRDSLSVQGSFPANLYDQPVLYVGGLAGRFERSGRGGAQVRLVTDRSFNATGRFVTFAPDGQGGVSYTPKDTKLPFVEGCGKGVMMIKNLEFKELVEAKIGEGAWVVLEDDDFPQALKNQKIGRVVSVRKRPEAPLWADVEVRPEWNLMALREVMVLKSSVGETASNR